MWRLAGPLGITRSSFRWPPHIRLTPTRFLCWWQALADREIFQDTPIAYRIGTNEIGTYQYSRWAEPPVEMLKGKLIRVLGASGDYQSVASLGSTSEGQFVVRGKLYDFEEVDGGGIAGTRVHGV